MHRHSSRVLMIRILISLGIGLSLLFIIASHPAMAAALSSKDTIVVLTDVHSNLAAKPLPESANVAISTNSLTVTLPYSIYLPLIRNYRPPSGIYGIVTDNGVPAVGVEVSLIRTSSVLSTTVTQADGSFQFASVPGLGPSQRYRVHYSGSDSSHIGWWDTRSITTYVTGSTVHIGDFDIANVELLTPTNGASATLPQTFQWTPRASVPSDSYEYAMLQGSNYYYSDPLGYASSFSLLSLPPGFVTGQSTIWTVWVRSPDGGSGIAYEGRNITFVTVRMLTNRALWLRVR